MLPKLLLRKQAEQKQTNKPKQPWNMFRNTDQATFSCHLLQFSVLKAKCLQISGMWKFGLKALLTWYKGELKKVGNKQHFNITLK